MAHIEERQVAAYWNGTLDPAELLRLDQHIEGCADCRVRLTKGAPASGVWETEADHLSFEDVKGLVGGGLADSRRVELEAHVAACKACRGDVEDLRSFQRELEGRRRRLGWWKAAAIAAGVLIAAWGLAKMLPRSEPALVAAIQDSGRTVGIASSGNLVGFAGEPEDAARMKALMETGRLVVAPLPDGVRTQATTFLGPDKAAQAFVPTAPLGQVVLQDRPGFAWTPLGGADWYRVQVMDDQFQPVAESGELRETKWQPEAPLPREKVLIWQVTARRKGETIRTPQPPLAEARFYVASKAVTDRIAAGMARQPISHLELAMLYAGAGLREEAEQELRTLAAENPGAALVERWMESLRSGTR